MIDSNPNKVTRRLRDRCGGSPSQQEASATSRSCLSPALITATHCTTGAQRRFFLSRLLTGVAPILRGTPSVASCDLRNCSRLSVHLSTSLSPCVSLRPSASLSGLSSVHCSALFPARRPGCTVAAGGLRVATQTCDTINDLVARRRHSNTAYFLFFAQPSLINAIIFISTAVFLQISTEFCERDSNSTI